MKERLAVCNCVSDFSKACIQTDGPMCGAFVLWSRSSEVALEHGLALSLH